MGREIEAVKREYEEKQARKGKGKKGEEGKGEDESKEGGKKEEKKEEKERDDKVCFFFAFPSFFIAILIYFMGSLLALYLSIM